MIKKITNARIGILSFIIVLLFMPIGHALMVFNEKIFHNFKFLGAFVIGLFGFVFLVIGVFKNKSPSLATLFGLLAGILVWTGWVEFSFVWIAEKLNVLPLIENGEVATKPEYLVMLSSLGLLCSILLLFLFSQNRCQFLNWIQKNFGFKKHLKFTKENTKPLAVITFIETIMILWLFYIVLLLVYDKDIAGDKHPITYVVAFGSLFWSIYLGLKLMKIQKFDYAIRYAIPTVIIFWNFVEVTGRWNLFKEIWVHPLEHWLENLIILGLLFGFLILYFFETFKNKKMVIKS